MIKLQDILAKHKKVVIVGGPKTGKTTASMGVSDRDVIHTDDYINLDWSEIPAAVNRDVMHKDRYLLEGVQVARCLRKGLVPDAVVLMEEPMAARTEGQAQMAKGVKKVLADWMKNKHPRTKVYPSDARSFWSMPRTT